MYAKYQSCAGQNFQNQLGYGSLTESVDDYVQINETIGIECLERFVSSVNKIYLELST